MRRGRLDGLGVLGVLVVLAVCLGVSATRGPVLRRRADAFGAA